jgi:O-antigen/teichoic acid export membrane protein
MVSERLRPLGKIAANAASLLTSDVLNKATTFGIYALLARYSDPRSFGQLSLGLLLLYTFQVFAVMGLPTVMTRQISKRPSRAGRCLGAAGLIVAATSLTTTAALALFTTAMQYERDTAIVILLLSFGLPPYALAIALESVFRGWEKMELIAFANVPVNLIKVAAAWWLLRKGHGVEAVACLLVGCRIAILLIEGWLYFVHQRRSAGADLFTIDLRYVRRLASKASTFFGMDAVIAIWGSANVVLLSKLAGEAEVGIYSAAWQLMVPARLFYQSIVNSVFPQMCRTMAAAPSRLKEMLQWIIEFLFAIGLPLSVALFFLAEPGLLLLYGEMEFAAAGDIVRILVGVLLLHTLTSALGNALWAASRERITLRIVVVNLAVNIVVAAILIPPFGAVGAAVAALAAWTVNAVQHYVACSSLLPGVSLAQSSWKPMVAGAAMASVFVILPNAVPWLAAAIAGATYICVMALLLFVSLGGREGRRESFWALWMK